jgi:hypothetical protein
MSVNQPSPIILDVCCGAMKIYNGYHTELVKNGTLISIDKRRGDFSYNDANKVIVKPTIIADAKYLPIKDECVTAIVCDPPHFDLGTSCENSYLYCKYGSWTVEETVSNLRSMDPEFARVLQVNGFLFLKIMSERKNIYQTLLKHFFFFLPIQVYRRRGNVEVDGAIWLHGFKLSQLPETTWEVVPDDEVVNPFLEVTN